MQWMVCTGHLTSVSQRARREGCSLHSTEPQSKAQYTLRSLCHWSLQARSDCVRDCSPWCCWWHRKCCNILEFEPLSARSHLLCTPDMTLKLFLLIKSVLFGWCSRWGRAVVAVAPGARGWQRPATDGAAAARGVQRHVRHAQPARTRVQRPVRHVPELHGITHSIQPMACGWFAALQKELFFKCSWSCV